jgi:hypothetical protein
MTRQQPRSTRATATRRPAVKNTAHAVAAGSQPKQVPTPDQRHQQIAETAFLIAEQRGFQGDMALDDWLQAEATVDAGIGTQH